MTILLSYLRVGLFNTKINAFLNFQYVFQNIVKFFYNLVKNLKQYFRILLKHPKALLFEYLWNILKYFLILHRPEAYFYAPVYRSEN